VLAYRIVEWGHPPELVETEVPRPGPGEVVVRVAGNGLCHSDLGMAQVPRAYGEALGWRVPFTLGHEVGGWVAEVGDGVTAVEAGDPVALVSASSCGHCAFCVAGHDNACTENGAGRGYGRDGGLAELVLVDSTRAIVPLGSLDPRLAGPLTDAGATTHHAVARVLPRLGHGSTAVVLGVGGLGAFAVQLLRTLSPARVIAVDPNPARRALAESYGATNALDGVDEDTATALEALTHGAGADAVLDLVGSDATIAAGLASTRRLGAFALVGAGGGTLRRPWWGALPPGAEVFTFQGGTIADVRAVVELAARGELRVDVEPFALVEVATAYERLDAGALQGRAVVQP
jgi:alcohol dehydrogenase, propanol-preferring